MYSAVYPDIYQSNPYPDLKKITIPFSSGNGNCNKDNGGTQLTAMVIIVRP